MRANASLLMSEGHYQAWEYPLPVLLREAEIARTRVNRAHATTALFTQMAINSAFSEKGAQTFSDRVSDMMKG